VLAADVKQFFATLSSKRSLRTEEFNQHTGNPIHPVRIVSELQKWLTQDVTVCVDMGSFHLWIAHFLFSFRARQILISNGQQTLGVALPWAIAAAVLLVAGVTLPEYFNVLFAPTGPRASVVSVDGELYKVAPAGLLTVGSLIAAMPFGMVVGAFVLAKMATPSTRMRMMGGWPSCPAPR